MRVSRMYFGPSRRCPSAIPGGPESRRGTEPPKRPMGSNELLPPSKLRRSQRLSGRNRDSEESPEATPPSLCNVCGPTRSSPKPAAIMLVQLPLELLFKILQYCDVNTLGLLSLCSKATRDRVTDYLHWGPTIKLLDVKEMTHEECIVHCRKLGVLMKRVTCVFSTKERLKIMLRFIEMFVSRPSLVRTRIPRDLALVVNTWRHYGAFLMAAIAGWVDSECQLVHEVVFGLSGASRLTTRVLGARLGCNRREELALRQFVHSVYLCESSPEDVTGWLHRLLQPWPLIFRAKMLFIIYGPCCHRESTPPRFEVMWELPSLPASAASVPVLSVALQQMGSALRGLFEYGAGWTTDDIITIIEELFGLYREWRAQNCAELLINCGLEICAALLTSKLINGREAQVVSIIFNMILVVNRSNMAPTLVVDVVQTVSHAVCSVNFLAALPNLSHMLLMEARSYYAGGELAGELQLYRALMSFCAAMLRRACVSSLCGVP
ncbi:F-box only protein 47-like [Amblyomma americanum]